MKSAIDSSSEAGDFPETRPTRFAWPIWKYLVALALATSLPIAAVAGVLAYHSISEYSQRTRIQYEERLRLMRSAVDLRITNVIEDLQVLARSPSLRSGDFEEFRKHALEAVDVIGAKAMVVYDKDGRQLFNTRLGPGEPLPIRQQFDTERLVFETGLPQVSGLLRAVIDKQPIVNVAVPVQVEGAMPYVLLVGLTPDYLSGLMDEYVSDGMIGSIIDAHGVLLTRRPLVDGMDLVGRPTIPEVLHRISEPSAFWIEAVSRDGTPTYTSFIKSAVTGWAINLAIPRDAVGGPLHRAAAVIVVLALGAVVLSIVLARLMAAYLLQPLARFEQYVLQLAFTREPELRFGPVIELNRMQLALRDVGNQIREAEQAVEKERALLRATVERMPIGVIVAAPDGEIVVINKRMLELWNISDPAAIDLRSDQNLEGQEPADGLDRPIKRALKDGLAENGTEIVRQVGGELRYLLMHAAPIFDEEGRTIAAVSACYDVTELRAALSTRQTLLDEINHRVKNTLATVQSIARLSRASGRTMQEYASAFEDRIVALSAAYNLLTANSWRGADLRDIVVQVVQPFARSDHIRVSGPAVVLPPRLALAFAAVIQELSTNAAKYGALSVPAGRLAASWTSPRDGWIHFDWIETGGPVVVKPTRRGFGTRLISEVFASESGWHADIEYDPRGLHCRLEVNVQNADSTASDSVDSAADAERAAIRESRRTAVAGH